MRAGLLVPLLMGIQFIPWPRLTLHFMLNKRPGYAFRRLYSRQQLIIHTEHRCEASGYHRSFIERGESPRVRPSIRCDLGGREGATMAGDDVREPRRNERGTSLLGYKQGIK